MQNSVLRFRTQNRNCRNRRLTKDRLRRKRICQFESLENRIVLDSTVTFNELSYNPGDKQDLEWIELYNQMAVDMDLSGWSIAGVDFVFESGTVIAAGDYLVIAKTPDEFLMATGISDALGPYAGQLANAGETIELINNSARVMDRIDYRDNSPWPVGADGSGATLAKRLPNTNSELSASWLASREVGGTPGAVNFPETVGPSMGPTNTLLDLDAVWRYDDSNTDWNDVWLKPGFDPDDPNGDGNSSDAWSSGPGLLGNISSTLSEPIRTNVSTEAATYYFRKEFQFAGLPATSVFQLNPIIDDGAVFYLNGLEVARTNMPSGTVTHDTEAETALGVPTFLNPLEISTNNLQLGTNVLSVEVHQAGSGSGTPKLEGSIIPAAGFDIIWNGNDGDFFSPGDVATVPDNLALASKGTTVFGSSQLGGDYLISGIHDGRYGDSYSWIPRASDSSPYNVVKFGSTVDIRGIAWGRDNGRSNQAGEACGVQCVDRSHGTYTLHFTQIANPSLFTPFSGNAATGWQNIGQVTYTGSVDDVIGAGFTSYYRHLFEVSQNSQPLSATALRIQLSDSSMAIDELEVYGTLGESQQADVVFGTDVVTADLIPAINQVVLNETAPGDAINFWLELANLSEPPVNLTGYQIGSSVAGTIPYSFAPQVLVRDTPLMVTEAELGFDVNVGDRLFLYSPSQLALIDAVRVDDVLRGRASELQHRWLYPNEATPGADNDFEFTHDVVINEIQYNEFQSSFDGQPQPEKTVSLIDVNAIWRYDDSQTDWSSGWLNADFDPDDPDGDGHQGDAWKSGAAPFGNTPITLSEPLQTMIDLGASTCYFLAEFSYDGSTPFSTLELDSIVDDGAVFYLNGTEIGRINMPNGPIAFSTPALESTVNPVFAPTIEISLENLVVGTNVLAVELHQAEAVGGGGPPQPIVGSILTQPGFEITWDGNDGEFFSESSHALAPDNRALAVNGTSVFSPTQAGGKHLKTNVNDGRYGDEYSWRAASNDPNPYIGLKFGETIDIQSIAWSRDNGNSSDTGCAGGQCTLGAQGTYTLQITEVANPNVITAETGNATTGWQTIGNIVVTGNVDNTMGGGFTSYFRHRLDVSQNSMPISATGFRIKVSNTNVTIDEIEVYTPETDAVFGATLFGIELSNLQATSESLEWIELYNRSATDTVDLTGWELSEAVQFGFPAGTSLGPEEYLLVANDADAVANKYPAVNNIVGSFSGGLSNHNEQIQLLDELGNPADEVHYYQSGRWPEYADGGGRTLELRDPFADNSRPEAWAASDESDNSDWLTYSYSGVVVADTYSSVSTRYQEFILGMLDGSEILLDDISLIEQPSTQGIQRLQNSGFESDTVGQSPANWRIGGTHQGVVINDPDNPSNQVLYLKTTAVMEDRYNHAETTLAGGAMIRNNIEYEISFRAKWLGGSNQLNTHLYYNRLPRTTLLAVPDATGTPGAVNSVFAGNIGPTYRDMVHNPVVPSAMESVTVSILAEDYQDVASMKLKYAVAGGAFQSVNMNDVGGGRYEGNIPAQSTSAIVQFYVEGVDAQGAVSTFPAAGAESRALYKVQDNQARTGSQIHNFRIIMTSDDAEMMFDPTKIMSNGRIGSTVIYNESEVFYDVGTRAAGSNAARGEINAARINFNVRFDSMRLFRGVHRTVAIDRSGHGMVRDSQDEILMKHIGNRAGNIPYQYDDLTYFIAPQSRFNRPAQLLLARQSDVFLDSQFDNGSEGTVFKFDIPYVPTNTDGGSEGSKLPSPYSHPGPHMDLQDLGDDKEFYRAHYYIRNNRRQDDYTQIIKMAKTFELTGTALEVAAYNVIDVDQWTRTFALLSLIGCLDAITQHPSNHNIKFYVRPSDHKVLALPWDWDYAYRQPTSSPLIGGSGNSSRTTQFLNRPSIRRMVHGHLLDIINTSFNNAYMNSWIDHYGDVADQEYGPIKNFISNRRSYVLNRLPTQFSFEIDTNGGSNFSTSNTVIELVGQGWIDVHEIRLAGSTEPLAVRWVNERDWKLTLPVAFGNNHFQFEAYNHQGQLVGTDSIVVTGQTGTPTLQNSLRITELNYNPYDPTAAELAVDSTLSSNDFEFIEIQNIAAQTIDLTTVQITDGIEFAFAPTQLAAGQRAVIVRDVAAFELRYGVGINVLGEFSSGGLNGNGERITLVDGALNTVLDFAYNDNDPWPIRADGHGATLELVNPSQTPSDQFGKYYHWRGSTEKGGTPGVAGQGPVGVVINEVLSHTDLPIVETDSIELVNTLASPIDIGGWFLSDAANNFLKYQIPESTVLEAGQYVVFDERHFNPTPATPGPNHFALNGLQGDDVWLVDPNGPGGTLLFVDDVHFDATVNGESLGRVPDSLGRIAPNVSLTLGRQNSKSRVGPIVISEFNYNPGFPTAADLAIDPNFQIDHLQWIEIVNPSGQTVDLSHWRLRGGADYDFPAGTSIDAGATLTVVSFDPSSVANADRVAAFRLHYGIDASVNLVGGFQGQLDKGADRISLQRALASPAEDSTIVPRAIEDEVVYDNLSPWPITSAGGISLNRNSASAAGNDVTNWSPDSPTPGLFTGSLLGDFNGDHLVNAMDIDLLFAEIKKGTHPPSFDLTGDMQVTPADTDQLVQVVLMTNYGDTDLDQDVDTGDLTNAIINFTSAGGTGKTWEDGDGDGDGDVDTGDLTTAIINFSGAAAVGLLSASNEVIVLPAVVDDLWQPEELLTADAELLMAPSGETDSVSQVELPKSNVQYGVFTGSTKHHSADGDAGTEKANDTLPVEPLELETGILQRKMWPGRSSR